MNKTPLHGWRRAATLLGILVICAGTTTSNRSCSLAGSGSNSGDGGDDPTFVATLQFSGSSMLSEVLQHVMFTDYVSFYVALLNGADPTPVRSIDYLKDRLAKG